MLATTEPTTSVTKAISVHQPHVGLVACEIKTLETKPSPPAGPMCPPGVRAFPGLAIELGERIALVATQTPVHPYLAKEAWDLLLAADAVSDPDTWPTLGAVVCTAVVAGAGMFVCWPELEPDGTPALEVVADDFIIWRPGGMVSRPADWIRGQLPLGDCTPGRWGWILADVHRYDEPIPVRGRQGVWRLPDDVAATVAELEASR